MSRFLRWTACSGLLVATLAFAPSSSPGNYRIVAHLPDVLDGRPLVSLRYDWESHRLFAGNEVGVYSADMSAAKPTMSGPLAKGLVQTVEVAPNIGRVFFDGPTEIGYLDEATGKSAVMADHYANSLAYEPTSKELYASFELLNKVAVYDAQTGQLKTEIPLPGWSAFQLVAVPGKVFMLVKGKSGIYAIDPAAHTVAEWPVEGDLTTPGRLEADTTGHYLFFARRSELDAIDIASRRIIGHVALFGEPTMSFDPDSGLLVVGWLDNSPEQRDVLEVLRPTIGSLEQVGKLSNETGGTTLVRSHYGFIQHGYHEFLVWSNAKAATTR